MIRALAGSMVLVSAAACAIPGLFRAPAPSEYEQGLALLGEGAFGAADSTLRSVASRCDPGEEGRSALLLLSSLHQDPRYARADADTAALMAARYLQLRDAPPAERRLAEGLYVRSLDRGGDPGLRPPPGFSTLAPEEMCGSRPDPAGSRPVTLPVLEAPTFHQLQALRRRLDSLTRVHRGVQGRLEEVEAELLMLRALLQVPDTGQARRPPGG